MLERDYCETIKRLGESIHTNQLFREVNVRQLGVCFSPTATFMYIIYHVFVVNCNAYDKIGYPIVMDNLIKIN